MSGIIKVRLHVGPHEMAVEPDVCPYEEKHRPDSAAATVVACLVDNDDGQIRHCPAFEWYAFDTEGRRRAAALRFWTITTDGVPPAPRRGTVMCKLAREENWNIGAR